MYNREKEEQFEAYYEQNLAPIVEQLEKERTEPLLNIKIGKKYTIGLFITTLFIVIGLLMWSDLHLLAYLNLFFISGLCYVTAYLIPKQKEKERVTKKIKHQLIEHIVHFVSPELFYEADSEIEPHCFEQANFLDQTMITDYKGEDLVYGKIGDLSIAFSGLKIRGRSTKEETSDIQLFNGIFFEIDFHKEFVGAVYTNINSAFINLLSNPQPNNHYEALESIRLENPKFMRRFQVHATDQILARYILTPRLMEQILQFEQKKNCYMQFAFRNGKMYLSMENLNTDLSLTYFTFNVYEDIEKEAVYRYLEEINTVLEIIEEMQLNINIWKSHN